MRKVRRNDVVWLYFLLSQSEHIPADDLDVWFLIRVTYVMQLKHVDAQLFHHYFIILHILY